MKKLCLLSTLFLSILVVQAQEKLDKDFFLLGTLDEYMGKRFYQDKPIVDQFYPNEGIIVSVLEPMLKTEYPDLTCKVEDSGHIILYSESLSKKIKEYYHITDKNFQETNSSHIEATLSINEFKNKQQKYSYLAGVFLKYGEVKNDRFFLKFANNGNKINICKELLKELGGIDIKFESQKTIPAINTISFLTDKELKQYLLKAQELKKNTKNKYSSH